MDGIKAILIIGAIAGSLYYVKNIKISVSGAQANLAQETLEADVESYDDEEVIVHQNKLNSRTDEPVSSPSKVVPLNSHDKMVSLIRNKELCQ